MIDDTDRRAQERVGSVLNEKWTLERLLGVGGMAAVYAARHRNGARAAVKVLHADLSRHREVRERFLREGYAANRVEHPGAVKVMDDDVVAGGPDAGTAYLVMELLEGESLQDRMERGPPVGERAFLRIAETVLDVLDVAHARGVVHRDLKPENLFLLRGVRGPGGEGEGEPRVKVLDFGLARLLDGQSTTSYGLALGTPSFMSPEQAAGRIDQIDGRTDLFALAATGFRLRTGRRIHEGTNAVELVGKMATFAAPKIDTFAPDVSRPFARVIDRALEYQRDDRYANAAEMREDVRRAMVELEGEDDILLRPSRPSPPSPPRPAPGGPVDSAPGSSSHGEATVELSGRDLGPTLPVLQMQPRRRRRSVLPWLALVVLLGVGAVMWLEARRQAALDASAAASAAVLAAAAAAAAPAPPVPVPAPAPAPAPVPPSAPASAPAPTSAPAPAPGHASTPARTPVPTVRSGASSRPLLKPPPRHSGKGTH